MRNASIIAQVRDGGEPGQGKDEFSLDVLDQGGSFHITPEPRSLAATFSSISRSGLSAVTAAAAAPPTANSRR